VKNLAFNRESAPVERLEREQAAAPGEHVAHRRGAATVREHLGTHLIADLYGASALDDIRTIRRCLVRCVEEAGATLLHLHLHPFDVHGGISGVAVLAESHISIHTWPEHRYAAVDAFMCGRACPQACLEVLRETFVPEQCIVQELQRGAAK
jgi:S-adenosylmethionine decarboxylase